MIIDGFKIYVRIMYCVLFFCFTLFFVLEVVYVSGNNLILKVL